MDSAIQREGFQRLVYLSGFQRQEQGPERRLQSRERHDSCLGRPPVRWKIRERLPRDESGILQCPPPCPSEGKRNSGLLYLAVGPDAIYPTSLECQIEETDVGDQWIVNGPSVTAFFIGPSLPTYDDDMSTGTPVRSVRGQSSRVLKSGDFENRDAWTTVEVIIQGDRRRDTEGRSCMAPAPASLHTPTKTLS